MNHSPPIDSSLDPGQQADAWRAAEPSRSPAAIERFWRSFEDAIENPLDTHDWFATAAAAFTPGDPVEAYTATADDGSHAAAAFVATRRVGARLDHPPGEWLGEPFDLPHTGEAALRLLVDQLVRSRRPIRFMRLYADSVTLRLLRAAADQHGRLTVDDAAPTPTIVLDAASQEPDHRLNSGRRSDLRRSRRRAEAIGTVEISIESPTDAESDAMLQEAFAVEGSGWKTREGTSVLADERYATFFSSFCHKAAAQGQLRVAFLRIGGRAVASQVAIERGHAFWVLKVGYNPEFSDCSPGILLMHEAIAYAASRKLERFEMLGQMEPWIAMWKPVLRNTVTVHFYPHSVAGLEARGIDWAKPRLRSLYRYASNTLVARILPRFVIGAEATDAVAMARRMVDEGRMTSIGYWSALDDASKKASDEYLRLIELLQDAPPEMRHLSIKLPAIHFKEDLLKRIVERAAETGIALHCDSHGPEEADRMRDLVGRFDAQGMALGYTVPARWSRSAADAAWAGSQRLMVRVVKGQWPDPQADPADLRTAYLKVIDALAATGTVRRVAVASHDVPLVKEAVQRLRAANVPCHLELLYGLPAKRSLAQAAALGLEVRFYLPYGTSYLPYSIKKALRQPRLLWWLVRGWAGLA